MSTAQRPWPLHTAQPATPTVENAAHWSIGDTRRKNDAQIYERLTSIHNLKRLIHIKHRCSLHNVHDRCTPLNRRHPPWRTLHNAQERKHNAIYNTRNHVNIHTAAQRSAGDTRREERGTTSKTNLFILTTDVHCTPSMTAAHRSTGDTHRGERCTLINRRHPP